MFGDAETYRRISGARSRFAKGAWYEPARPHGMSCPLFAMRDETRRRELKTKLTPAVISLPIPFSETHDLNFSQSLKNANTNTKLN